MKIFIASDHGGFLIKEQIKQDLRSWGHEVIDLGNNEFEKNDDYPDFVIPCAEKVKENPGSMGVVLGRSGNGEAIAANKVKGIRAAVVLNEVMAKKAREDNDANVIAIGADFVKRENLEKILDVFVDTPFSDKERHIRRIGKITHYESAST